MEQRASLEAGLLRVHAFAAARNARGRAAPAPRSPRRTPRPRAAPSGSAPHALGGARRPPSRTRTPTRSGMSSSRSTEPTTIGSSDSRYASDCDRSPCGRRTRRARSTAAPRRDRAGGRLLHVVTVHPGQLVDVEHGRAVADRFEIEPARHLVGRQDFLVLPRRPAEQREVVDQRLGQDAARAELRHPRRAVTLRQRRVIRPQHERQMRERRRRAPSASYSSTCRGVFEM